MSNYQTRAVNSSPSSSFKLVFFKSKTWRGAPQSARGAKLEALYRCLGLEETESVPTISGSLTLDREIAGYGNSFASCVLLHVPLWFARLEQEAKRVFGMIIGRN
ncbi:hypothetical protein Rs2_48275 [Raphanus sativus]|nr:hypothetical protein Rs2_48275 [Raphanus sativus]